MALARPLVTPGAAVADRATHLQRRVGNTPEQAAAVLPFVNKMQVNQQLLQLSESLCK